MNSLPWGEVMIDGLASAAFLSLGIALFVPLLAWVSVRFRTAGWLLVVGLQSLASVPSVLLAISVLVPFHLASLSWPENTAQVWGRVFFALTVLLAALPPGLLALRRVLLDLEQDLGLVARSRGWGRTKLLAQLLTHPQATGALRTSLGSGLLQLANLELLLGFLGELGLGGGLTGAHRSWGQLLVRLREPLRYGYSPQEVEAGLTVTLGLLLFLYGLGSWLTHGERRADYL